MTQQQPHRDEIQGQAGQWRMALRQPEAWLRPYVTAFAAYAERLDGPLLRRELPTTQHTLIINLGGGVIMISPDAADRPVSGTQEVYIALDAVDAHYERARAAGAEIVRPIGEQPYGSREYAARDLEGNTWHFGTYRPTVSP